ncbi:hypothetical protein LEN26_002220 [Aphanomyces euteiches]|nr:hypothetical protein AeMF1_004936 [Aphanomyces euteiches]KAH9159659.1 hypothetical protein LEN26_002220 [Aphanomyces euteiches]KAH9186996.1 hypothetical protein AeNC1_011029 [Aphanomyces euteiches]
MQQYTEIKHLANAIYGDVVLCKDNKSGHLVVIKRAIIEHCKAHKPVAQQYRHVIVSEDIYVERKLLRELSQGRGHPHVLRLVADFDTKEAHHFVVEYCSKGDLFDVLYKAPGCRFDLTQAQTYFRQIVSAVAFLHAKGYAHRDLSFENVLVNDKNECKLMDFGLAVDLYTPQTAEVGKPYYMPPEVASRRSSSPPYDPAKVDVWALGIMLFIMLTGNQLFDKAVDRYANFQIFKSSGLRGLVASNKRWAATMPTHVLDLLDKMIRMNPAERMTIDQVASHAFVNLSATTPIDRTKKGDANPMKWLEMRFPRLSFTAK